MSVMHAHTCMHVHTCTHAWGSPPIPHKKIQGPTLITSRDMAHYVLGCKTPYVSNAMSMQTLKYVCITDNMHTHKFEFPAKILSLDKGNYGESAQIYVTMRSYMNTYNITHTHM